MNRRFSFTRNAPTRERIPLRIPPISLMWPGERPTVETTSTNWQHDLGIEDLVAAFTGDRRYRGYIRALLSDLSGDADTIAWRQAVLADFQANPVLVQAVEALLPRLSAMMEDNVLLGKKRRSLLLTTADRLAELDLYVEVVQELFTALDAAQLESAALIQLHSSLGDLLRDENFQTLRAELPALRQPLQRITSLTVGINLDTELRPESAVLLSINDRPMKEGMSLLERLVGARADEDDTSGIAPVNYVPKDADLRPFNALFQDLDRLVKDIAEPVAQALNRYTRSSGEPMAMLEKELAYYVFALRLIQKLEKRGITFCRPEIAPADERVTHIEGLRNIALCLNGEGQPVASDVEFGEAGHIALLTGPNSGGKTTYLRAVGLAQAMFQAGLFIPAMAARISPVDHILTHFPAPETRELGRLAEESKRLRAIFQHATRHSLVLMNETFSSTAFGEAIYLAQDILSGLRSIGVRAIYATHLVELVDHIDEIEAAVTGDCRLFSLVAGIRLEDGEAIPTFEVRRGLPLGRSYAQEIARRHGISLAQILTLRSEK